MKFRLFFSALALLCLSVVAHAQLPQASIQGTAYLPTGAVAANVRITLVKARVSGQSMAIINQTYTTDPSGQYSFSVPRNSTVWIYSNIIGLNTNGATGTPISIPNAAGPYDLKDLITVPSVPSQGIVVKDNGTALTSLVGTINFIGATVTQPTAGVANITVSGGGGGNSSSSLALRVEEVDGLPSVTSVSTLQFDQADGFVVSTTDTGVAKVDLSAVPLARLSITGTPDGTKFLRDDGSWQTVSGSGTGDFSSNTSTSVDSEIVLFSGTGGKTGKRATGSGIALLTSGVLSTVTAPGGTIVGTSDSQTLTNKTITTSGLLTVNGGMVWKRTATAISYTVLVTDALVSITDTSAARTITLPASAGVATGQTFTITDESNNATAQPITITRSGSDTFLGGGTSVLLDVSGGSVSVFWNGSVWIIR